MTVYEISTADELKTRLNYKTYGPGDEIVIAPGTYDLTSGSGYQYVVFGDGYTIRGADPNNPPIITRGNNSGDWTNGLVIVGHDVTVRDLRIEGCREVGIRCGWPKEHPGKSSGIHLQNIWLSGNGVGIYFEAENCDAYGITVTDGIAARDDGGWDNDYGGTAFITRCNRVLIDGLTAVNMYVPISDYVVDGSVFEYEAQADNENASLVLRNFVAVNCNTIFEGGAMAAGRSMRGVVLENFVVVNDTVFRAYDGEIIKKKDGTNYTSIQWVTCHTRWNARSSYVISEAPHELTYRNGFIVNTLRSYAPGLDKWLASGELVLDNVRWWEPDDGVYTLGNAGVPVKNIVSFTNRIRATLASLLGMRDSFKIIERLRELGLHAAETGNPYASLVGTIDPLPPTTEPGPTEPTEPDKPGAGVASARLDLRIYAELDGTQIELTDAVASMNIPRDAISDRERMILEMFRKLPDVQKGALQELLTSMI